jgi:hypothetical protein
MDSKSYVITEPVLELSAKVIEKNITNTCIYYIHINILILILLFKKKKFNIT